MNQLILPNQLNSKKEVSQFVSDIVPDDISGEQAVKAVVLSSKLKLISEQIREKCESKAYGFIETIKDFSIDGAKVATTQPKEVVQWQYSEELEQLRQSYQNEINDMEKEIEKRRRLIVIEEEKEQIEGIAKKLSTGEIKKGQLKVTIDGN